MRIGLLGTGHLATALGRAWTRAGHSVVVTGRDPQRVKAAVQQIGSAAESLARGDFAAHVDVVVVAIAWDGLREALDLVGASDGSLAGKTVVDCTNPIDYATGRMTIDNGSAAELVAGVATEAHVVKALHLFAGAAWPFIGEPDQAPVVAICGDDAAAVRTVETLVADLGARSAVLGGLDACRQAEEAAGFVMRLVAAGANPRFAVPDVEPGRTT